MSAAATTGTAMTSRRPVPGEAGGAGEAPQAPTLGTHRGELVPGSSEASRARRDERLRQGGGFWRHSVGERRRDCGGKGPARLVARPGGVVPDQAGLHRPRVTGHPAHLEQFQGRAGDAGVR